MSLDLRPFHVDPDRTPRQLRRDGVLLVLLGGFLLAILVLLALAHLQVFDVLALVPGVVRDASAAANPPLPVGTRLVFALFVAFAVTAIAEGAWRLVHGTRNALLVRVMIALAIVFFVGGYLVMGLQGERVHLPRA